MTKPDGLAPDANDDVSPAAWGTWEELLLAFAVNRHGTGAWDSIATELQKRTSDPNLCLTAHNCRSKYLDLKRRFLLKNGDLEGDDGRDDKSSVEESAPLLEELRKLRVAELRREVQRYDLNIESLELKMKRMEEERERREKSEADLENNIDEKKNCEEEAAPAAGGEPAVGGELEKDRLSVNESNSTDPEAEKLRAGEAGSEPAGAGGEEVRNDRLGHASDKPAQSKPEPDRKSIREDSCNGSSNSIEELDRDAKAEPVAGSAESEAESDGGDAAAMKENSDVQSSASRSRKEEGSDKVRHGSTSGDEREHEDQSCAVKALPAESQPFVDFLRAIRAPKIGSIFERRHRSQETSKYQKLILQHMDLDTVETRLKEGWYTGSATKFYRDLLLLVNNALIFFTKNSSEVNAAMEIRRLISKEISPKHAKSDSSSGKQISLQSLSMPKKEEAEASPSPSLMLKPRISGSLIVCRKRSSITKATTSSSGTDKKKEHTILLSEEKDAKQQRSQQSGDADEPKITKKRTRDRFPAASSANSKKNGKNQASNNKISAAESVKQQGKGGPSSLQQQPAEAKIDNKKSHSTSDAKKRGAANFLSRMKQGSSSNNGVLLDALKNTPLTSESTTGKGGSDNKKSETVKRGEKKEPAASARRGTETRQTKEKEKEKSSPGKRNVGRPPKRGSAQPPPALGKRGRDRGDTEPPAASKQPKKRTRKL